MLFRLSIVFKLKFHLSDDIAVRCKYLSFDREEHNRRGLCLAVRYLGPIVKIKIESEIIILGSFIYFVIKIESDSTNKVGSI